MNIRLQQKIDTKHKINKAVNKLAEIHGIDNLKVREICKEANISIGTFYNYYDSIQSIIVDSIVEHNELSKTALEMILVNDDEIKNFELLIRHQIGEFRNVPNSLCKEIFKIFLDYPEEKILALNRSSFDLMYGMIERGQAKNQITKVMEINLMTKMILKLIIGNCFVNCMHRENYDFTQNLIDEVNTIIKIR